MVWGNQGRGSRSTRRSTFTSLERWGSSYNPEIVYTKLHRFSRDFFRNETRRLHPRVKSREISPWLPWMPRERQVRFVKRRTDCETDNSDNQTVDQSLDVDIFTFIDTSWYANGSEAVVRYLYHAGQNYGWGKPDNAKGKPWDLTGVALAVEFLIHSFSLLTWCWHFTK